MYVSLLSLAHMDELKDQLDGSGFSLTNPPFRLIPILLKKIANPARTKDNPAKSETNLATNVVKNQGRRDAHRDRKDTHPGEKDTDLGRKNPTQKAIISSYLVNVVAVFCGRSFKT